MMRLSKTTTAGKEKNMEYYRLTKKGIALMIAMEEKLIPRKWFGGYDLSRFERFWNRLEKALNDGLDHSEDLPVVFEDQSNESTDNQH